MGRRRSGHHAVAGETPREAAQTHTLASSAHSGGDLVIPLLREEASLQKQVVETGRVAVVRGTHEHSDVIVEPLATETVEITRVPIGRRVDSMPEIHIDGDTVVVPVVEERLSIERQLFLAEEVRVRRVRASHPHTERVTLRHHVVTITERRANMKYHTIAAAFDTRARAQTAANALRAAGFHSADISVVDSDVALNGAAWTSKSPSLWQRIFGSGLHEHEATVYQQTVDRGGAVLSVRVPDNEVAHATGVLDLHHPIDVSDRALTSGFAPAAKIDAAAKRTALPVMARQAVAVSPKLAGLHDQVLPLAEEQLQVGKRMIETGKTRVRRFVTERDVSADVTLHEEHAEIIRRAVADGKVVGNIDWADREIEVTETAEQALVNKTARVVEEVLLKKVGSDHVETLHDKVRRQQVNVERVGPDGRRVEELAGAGSK